MRTKRNSHNVVPPARFENGWLPRLHSPKLQPGAFTPLLFKPVLRRAAGIGIGEETERRAAGHVRSA